MAPAKWHRTCTPGVLLYQLVSGHPPFMGSLTDVFNGHLNHEPRPIRRSDGSGPHPLLQEAIEKALQKHAHRRFASAEEFAAQLESIRFLVAAGAPSDDSDHSYDDDSVLTKAWHTSATRWALAGLAGLAIAGTAFIGLRAAPLHAVENARRNDRAIASGVPDATCRRRAR